MLNIQFENNQLYTIWGDVRSGSLKIYLNHYNQNDSSNTVHEIAQETRLYPNPSSGIFALPSQLHAKPFKLYTLEGQLVLKGTTQAKLDLGQLPSGTYILQLEERSYTLLKN